MDPDLGNLKVAINEILMVLNMNIIIKIENIIRILL
jgi:hypothetical protein